MHFAAFLLGVLLAQARALQDQEKHKAVWKISLHPGEGTGAEMKGGEEHYAGVYLLNRGQEGKENTCWTSVFDVSVWRTKETDINVERGTLGTCNQFETLGKDSYMGLAITSKVNLGIKGVDVFLSRENKDNETKTLNCNGGDNPEGNKGQVLLCGKMEDHKLSPAVWDIKVNPGNRRQDMKDEVTYAKIKIRTGKEQETFCETDKFDVSKLKNNEVVQVPGGVLGTCGFFRGDGDKVRLDVVMVWGGRLSADRVDVVFDDEKASTSCRHENHSINLSGKMPQKNIPCGGGESEGFIPAIWDIVLHPGTLIEDMDEEEREVKLQFNRNNEDGSKCSTNTIKILPLRSNESLKVRESLLLCNAFRIPDKKFTMDVQLQHGEGRVSMSEVEVLFNDEKSTSCKFDGHSINLSGRQAEKGIPCGDGEGHNFIPAIWDIILHPGARIGDMDDEERNVVLQFNTNDTKDDSECRTNTIDVLPLKSNQNLKVKEVLRCGAFRIPDKNFTMDVELEHGEGRVSLSEVEVLFNDETSVLCKFDDHSINLSGREPEKGIPCGGGESHNFIPAIWGIVLHPGSKIGEMDEEEREATIYFNRNDKDSPKCSTNTINVLPLRSNKDIMAKDVFRCNGFRIPKKNFTMDVELLYGQGRLSVSEVEVLFNDETDMDTERSKIPCTDEP